MHVIVSWEWSLPAGSNKSDMGSTVLNHLGPSTCVQQIHCTGHKYWLYTCIMTSHECWLNKYWLYTCIMTSHECWLKGCPPLMALHCRSRTGHPWCMWNSQSVHLKVFWNLCPCLLAFAPCCDFGCSGVACDQYESKKGNHSHYIQQIPTVR